MKIAIAGHTGFIGTALKNALTSEDIIPINREDLYTEFETLKSKIIEADIVINFAGAPISKRWNKKNKKEIKNSRFITTQNIVKCINEIEVRYKPQMFIQASAVGIYAEQGIHDESSEIYADNFLAEVVKRWEGQTEELNDSVKITIIRIGLVLDKGKGALSKMEPLFRLGLGSTFGTGKQIYPFIHIEDVVGSILYIIKNEMKGLYNLTSPNPVTNKKFSKELANAMNRPLFFRIPEFMMRVLLGKSAIIVTRGQNAIPNNLVNAGYKFKYVDIRKVFKDFYESN